MVFELVIRMADEELSQSVDMGWVRYLQRLMGNGLAKKGNSDSRGVLRGDAPQRVSRATRTATPRRRFNGFFNFIFSPWDLKWSATIDQEENIKPL